MLHDPKMKNTEALFEEIFFLFGKRPFFSSTAAALQPLPSTR